MYLPLDIFTHILNFCDFKIQVYLTSTNNFLRNNLKITNLYNIEKKYLRLLTDEILNQKIFNQVEALDAAYNKKITNVSMVRSLKKLNAEGNCGIDQNGINGLDLVKLKASYNKKITNVSMISSLKILHACGNCGIDQNGINGLDLVELDASHNKKITNVSTMRSLKILKAYGECGIDQNGINGLDLVEFYAGNNEKITNVSSKIFC
jgi:hypothetical protein